MGGSPGTAQESGAAAGPIEAYFAAVEETFSRLRGRPLLLSPRDVARVKVWHANGMPLRIVLRALERFFARAAARASPRRLAPSLEFCERDVYELWEEWRAASLGAGAPAPAGDGEPGALLAAHLARALEPLARARERARSEGRAAIERAIERVAKRMAERIEKGTAGDLSAIEEELAGDERKLVAAVRAGLGEAERKQLSERVRREVDAIAGGMDERAREVLLRKAEERALLARFGIPRLALFAF